jgi:hypothetical protein
MESKFDQDPVSGARWEIRGSSEDIPIVEVWADDYMPFEPAPTSWKWELRDEIRSRCQLLRPSAGQMLNATFFGAVPPRSDVENLVLYNIDDTFKSFKQAGCNGVRFEHGAEVPPPAPSGETYPFCFRYALAPRPDTFIGWDQGRTLASFDWTDLGGFAGDNKLAQVWLALARSDVEPFFPAVAPEAKFAVRVEVRPPRAKEWTLGKLMKPVFDGVICAFQAHTDLSVLPEVLPLLAKQLQADPEEIRGYLLDQRQAVLGTVKGLVAPFRAGVKWYPSDHWCVAGELLAAESTDDRWAIKAKIVDLSRRNS